MQIVGSSAVPEEEWNYCKILGLALYWIFSAWEREKVRKDFYSSDAIFSPERERKCKEKQKKKVMEREMEKCW
jgi:hypothetical protein